MDTPHCASEICLWCSAAIYSDSNWPVGQILDELRQPGSYQFIAPEERS